MAQGRRHRLGSPYPLSTGSKVLPTLGPTASHKPGCLLQTQEVCRQCLHGNTSALSPLILGWLGRLLGNACGVGEPPTPWGMAPAGAGAVTARQHQSEVLPTCVAVMEAKGQRPSWVDAHLKTVHFVITCHCKKQHRKSHVPCTLHPVPYDIHRVRVQSQLDAGRGTPTSPAQTPCTCLQVCMCHGVCVHVWV
jgi:hypothetical protein